MWAGVAGACRREKSPRRHTNSNITENGLEAEKNRAAIWEVDRATGRWRIFASGLRDPNGLTFEPESGPYGRS